MSHPEQLVPSNTLPKSKKKSGTSKKRRSEGESTGNTQTKNEEALPETIDRDARSGDVTKEPGPEASLPHRGDKKRKRDHEAIDELEIDLKLPEPPSKKALRKAKKEKSGSAPSVDATKRNSVQEQGVHQPTGHSGRADTSDATQKRSEFGIWIGNLSWSATKEGLRLFFTKNSQLTDSDLTRIHMPKPKDNTRDKNRIKPNNMGFAYVDFASEAAMVSAMALNETVLDGRNVLIKNAKSFEGRPQKERPDINGTGQGKPAKPPNKRVFVGNLGYDVTRDEIFEFFSPCGQVEDVFLATFEDSGKCKGYGWVTFAEVQAAEAAVRGYTYQTADAAPGSASAEPLDDKDQEKKKAKPRKWFVNKIQGRPLRCEFAEDPSVRYKKRFGKDRSTEDERVHND